nr:hypothetical protein [Desulfitobacterium hafniense]
WDCVRITKGIEARRSSKMIKVYSNYVACDTQEEALEAQVIIINAMSHIPKICEDRDMFLVHHELGECKMQELLNQRGLACK